MSRGEDPKRVAIIGGGYAGLAAAVTLADAGCPVTLFEQARTLGGRARRVPLDGATLDNGQHLAIGGYRTLLELVRKVHGDAPERSLFERLPLTLAPFGRTLANPVALRAAALPSPLHLALGVLRARGLALRDRLALITGYRQLERAGFRCPPRQTVAECFAATPRRAFDALWAPLCIAALNTPPERASAQVFVNVLREVFAAPAAASDFLIPAVDLTELFPAAAASYVADRGGDIRTGIAVRRFAVDGSAVTVESREATARYAALVVAVGPHQLAALSGAQAVSDPPPEAAEHEASPQRGVPDAAATAWREAVAQVTAFGYESITTVYLGYPDAVALPAPIARLDDAPGQWLFDRSRMVSASLPVGVKGLLAVVISANGPHDAEPHPVLAARVDAQLRRLSPGLPRAVWSQVIAERRATYACAPGLARPAAGRLSPRLYLAGDYTDPALPATLEAAVRSGLTAAQALLADCGELQI